MALSEKELEELAPHVASLTERIVPQVAAVFAATYGQAIPIAAGQRLNFRERCLVEALVASTVSLLLTMRAEELKKGTET